MLTELEMILFREVKGFLSDRTDVLVLDRLFVTCFDVELEMMAVIKRLDKVTALAAISEETVSILLAMNGVDGMLVGGASQKPLSICSVPVVFRVLLVLVVSIDTFLGFVYSKTETGFCRKLTDVGLSVGPDKWVLENRDSMVVTSVLKKKEFRDVAVGDLFLACDGTCVVRYVLYNPRDLLFSLKDASSQFR